MMALAPAAGAQVRLPYGFSASSQDEYSYGRTTGGFSTDERKRIFENWVDLGYAANDFSSGVRFVAFQPPDPSIYQGPESYGVDFAHAEYTSKRVEARGGNFYAMFGRGLALRLYEDRTLRVDNNALGGIATLHLHDGDVTALTGATVEGNVEDASPQRSQPLYGVDAENGVWAPAKLRVGGSFATIDVRRADQTLSPLRMKAGRVSGTLAGVDLYGELAGVDGPTVAAARRRGFTGPDFHGHGLYTSASTAVGGVGVELEYKDYDALAFVNDGGKSLVVPPSALRNHTFNLLNRHPHQLDPIDERGFQAEGTWVTKRLSHANPTSFLANWGWTFNHDQGVLGNYFDDSYFEVQQDVGRLSVIAGLSHQRKFETSETPNPFRTLWTPVTDLRYRLNDVHSLHVQLEHQHDSSDIYGDFDVEFGVLEWSRSPGLTLGLLAEHSNKSDLQLRDLEETGRNFVGGTVDYSLFGQHELRLFYGKRNAGFICVGGVCRLEPAFDGVELTIVSHF